MIQIMGVLNVTPDSFSDGGRYLGTPDAVTHAIEMAEHGAHVIDVGGESTRPGADPLDVASEIARVVPVIEQLADRLLRPDGSMARISIDTRNDATARAAVAAGADLVNDVSSALWPTAAELGVGWVAMHMLGDPRTMQRSPTYVDVVTEVRRYLVEVADKAAEAGVTEIWIDPGIGFGKTTRHNLELLARLDELVDSPYPVLVGTSRKRFLGEMTSRSDRKIGALVDRGMGTGDAAAHDVVQDVVPVHDRLEASVSTAVWSMTQGARMIRVHDVQATRAAVAVVEGSIPQR